MDSRLGAEIGVHRQQRDAIRLLHAVAAALTHALVDHDAARRLGQDSAAAPPPLFRSAELVVDHYRDALGSSQFGQHLFQILARAEFSGLGQTGPLPELRRILAKHDDLGDTLGLELARQRGHWQRSGSLLPAGHGHSVVVKDLECDIDPGRDGGLHRQSTGVKVGAVTKILKQMLGAAERGHSDPRRPLRSHLEQELDAPTDIPHQPSHAVAADTAAGELPLQQQGRPVVRTARAVARGTGAASRAKACRSRVFARRPLGQHGHVSQETAQC